MNSLLEEGRGHLAGLLEASQRCAWHLCASADRVPWPVTEKELAARSMDLALFEPLAAVNERFGKLQDLLGGTMRHLGVLCGEDTSTFLRVLSFCAKEGIIESVEEWQACRALRNRAAHDYGTNYAATAGHFNALHAQIPVLIGVTLRLTDYAFQTMGIKADDPRFAEALRSHG
jgi:hypothetical protein